ncbi:MAG TPA: hypothetical protein VFW22_05745 [Pseudolabrys sp.]|nr:hypothetical protein [Pseudolabrys sp.]
MKWLGASGAVFATLLLAVIGTVFVREGGTAVMDDVPWGLVLLVALLAIMALAGVSLYHARSDAAIIVFFASAIFSFPLLLLWLAGLGD